MTTILFPSAVNALVVDSAERAIFVGTASSIIHQFNFIHSTGGKYEPIGGDPSHPLQARESAKYDFRGHSTEISAINLSFDGTLLVSGDNSGEIFVWDVGSRQVLRKIKGQNGTFPSYRD
jgi:pre-rRNA-processing protein IPI3